MLQRQVRYFVRSSYKRGRDYQSEPVREAFIISHYHSLAEAERHFNNVLYDPYRFLYDAQNVQHLERLNIAAGINNYKVYSQLIIPGIEKKATKRYARQTSLYLFRNSGWDLKPGVTVNPELYMQGGELYAKIGYHGNEITVKFEDIENTR